MVKEELFEIKSLFKAKKPSVNSVVLLNAFLELN